MTQRERDRLVALRKADKKLITQKQAAQQTGLSERHLRRLLAKLRSEGDQAVVHAARGRASNRKLSAKAEKQAVAILSQPVYAGFGDSGGGVSRAAPRRPSRPRNAWPPRACGSRTPASVAAPPQLPRRAGAMGHSEHDGWRDAGTGLIVRRQQRVAGALRPARLGRRRRLLRRIGTKRPTRFYTDRASLLTRLVLASHADRAGAPSWTSNRSRPIRRRPKAASSAALAPPRTAWCAGGATFGQRLPGKRVLPWWNATLRVQPAQASRARSRARLDSALSHVETRRVANDYTIRFRGKSYQIDRSCAGSAKQPSAGGETPGRRPGRAPQSWPKSAQAEPAAAGREGWRQSCRQAKQRLDEGHLKAARLWKRRRHPALGEDTQD